MKKLLLLFLLAPICIIAQNAEDSAFIKKMADDVLTNGKAYDNLYELTKNIGGRLAGSPQYNKAVEWGKKKMEIAGADNVFLQECMVPNWKRGGKDAAYILEQNGKKSKVALDALALGNSLGSGPKGVTAKVLAVMNFSELEKRKDEAKGSIVFFNNGFNPTYISTGRAYGEAGVYRRNGASIAAKYGAAAIMIRSLSSGTDNNPHTGSMTYQDSLPKIPAIAIGLKDADKIWELSKQNQLTVSLFTYGKFNPDTTNHNVIGELMGIEFPNEYITVGGHLDSWDVNEGAHDDGAGVVQTIEILRALKAMGYKPKRTIRFVLFANEENGLRGGQKYAAEAKRNNEKHLFAMESDAGGFTPRAIGFTTNTPAQYEKVQSWASLLKPYGVLTFDNSGGGADIGPLRSLGTVLCGYEPDGQRYFDLHHARTDVFENVNKRELLLGALNMAAVIYLVDKYGL
jgi:carboxypeptidase Q